MKTNLLLSYAQTVKIMLDFSQQKDIYIYIYKLHPTKNLLSDASSAAEEWRMTPNFAFEKPEIERCRFVLK